METTVLIETMKRFLKAQGITYKDLAQRMELSEVTIKRQFSSGGFSLDRFLKICKVTDIDFKKLVISCQSGIGEESHEYTLEQENFFVKNPKYLSYFDLLLRFGSIKSANKKSNLSKKETEYCLLKLDKLSLIEYHSNNKIKFPIGRNVKWRKNGPLRKKLLPRAKNEFLNSEFDLENSLFHFSLLDISSDSLEKLNVQINSLLKKASIDSEIDQTLKKGTERVGIIMATRPWDFSVLKGKP